MGRQALVSHGTRQKHQNITKSISVFTKEKHIKANTNSSSMSSSNSMKSVTNTQSTVSNFVISSETVQFVIFKPLSFCFKETIGFDVKASFASRPVSRLID